LQIEKDHSDSLVIVAINMPESLDLALFRRFDDIISYPLPDLEQITKFYKIELADLLKKKKLPVDQLAKESVGLSYSDINKVCQDFFKDILVYGTEKATLDLLFDYIKSRKRPF